MTRVKLINCDLRILNLIGQGDDALAAGLGVTVPHPWTEFRDALPYVIERLNKHPNDASWWTYLPVDMHSNTLLGSCGFKGKPIDGLVEIGYEVAQNYRGQGFATEMARLLVKKGFEDQSVQMIQAHTLPTENASTAVLKKNSFNFSHEISHQGHGLIWKWILNRADYFSA